MVALGAIPIAAVLLLATAGLAVRARYLARLAGRVASARAQRARYSERLHNLRARDGGCATRFPGRVGAISTVSRSRPVGLRSRLRRRPETTARSTWRIRVRWPVAVRAPPLLVPARRAPRAVRSSRARPGAARERSVGFSRDRLASALRVSAGTVARPAFLAPLDARGAR